MLGLVGIARGQIEEGRALLLRLRKDDEPYAIAEACCALGETSEALDQLERAFDNRSPQLLGLRGDPFLDTLNSHPDFFDWCGRFTSTFSRPTSATCLTEHSIPVRAIRHTGSGAVGCSVWEDRCADNSPADR